MKKRRRMEALEQASIAQEAATATAPSRKPRKSDRAGSPCSEASQDPAPAAGSPPEKSQFEARETFRSRKGDRFS